MPVQCRACSFSIVRGVNRRLTLSLSYRGITGAAHVVVVITLLLKKSLYK